ncbi:phosphoadenylyl-sulfate reductase [Chryseobacterium sp. D764]|jgi:phosphoadenosine phosphosulfate reductase|uniref:phosphoadenylyl-sulfate reductase n=1 Tax=unclassified Chryseobacterium TaxID=2593645 RepID=UPI00098717A1|nr:MULTISPECIES: phosphoadenylyl-sulfate reductase [unclassified Chryseobacterium]QXU50203.1 phosphoadenylyl-sulfate reductase [Chryseobacterium sp. D764]CAD0218644.1 Phosphoadenylyl-sulfate reductase [Chryseobacterium sp. JV274]
MEYSLKNEFENIVKEASEASFQTNGLQLLTERFPGKVIFSTSFSYEDQVITHLIKDLNIEIFTLDTGRLFEQTYETWTSTKAFFKKNIKAYYPDTEELREFVTENGPDSFYQSVEKRKACCTIRKVHPLKKALEGYKVWITGLRSEHSANRQNMPQLEWDPDNKIIKYHPILHWTSEQVTDYVKDHHLPYNHLHKKGFVSIGCEPCTRAIKEGEDFRAGRWWWEDANKKECGLHIHQ